MFQCGVVKTFATISQLSLKVLISQIPVYRTNKIKNTVIDKNAD